MMTEKEPLWNTLIELDPPIGEPLRFRAVDGKQLEFRAGEKSIPGTRSVILSTNLDCRDLFTLGEVLTKDDEGNPEITVFNLSEWGTQFHAPSPSRCEDSKYFKDTVNAIIEERKK